MTESILVRNSDGLILGHGAAIAFEVLRVRIDGHLITDQSVTAETCAIFSGVDLPGDFSVGNYRYTAQGGLALTASGAAAKGEQVVAAVIAKLEALGVYGRAYEQGGTTVNGFHYDTDDMTQAKLGNAYQLAQTASSPPSFAWWMSSGWHDIPKAQIIADAPVVAAWVEAVYRHIGVHYAAVASLRTLADVAAYDYTTGWPVGT